MKITISGLSGSGTSTIARMLSKKLNLPYVNAGDIWRRMAKSRNLSLLELNMLGEKDASIDRELDEKMLSLAANRENTILEGRIIGWLCAKNNINAFKVWLKCPLEVRIQRICQRENKNYHEIERETVPREKSEAKRYKDYYDIDINNLSIYDLVVDSRRKKPNEIVGIVLNKLKIRKWI